MFQTCNGVVAQASSGCTAAASAPNDTHKPEPQDAPTPAQGYYATASTTELFTAAQPALVAAQQNTAAVAGAASPLSLNAQAVIKPCPADATVTEETATASTPEAAAVTPQTASPINMCGVAITAHAECAAAPHVLVGPCIASAAVSIEQTAPAAAAACKTSLTAVDMCETALVTQTGPQAAVLACGDSQMALDCASRLHAAVTAADQMPEKGSLATASCQNPTADAVTTPTVADNSRVQQLPETAFDDSSSTAAVACRPPKPAHSADTATIMNQPPMYDSAKSAQTAGAAAASAAAVTWLAFRRSRVVRNSDNALWQSTSPAEKCTMDLSKQGMELR